MNKPSSPIVFILASLLLHLLFGAAAQFWPRQPPPIHVVYQPGEPDQRPFERRERQAVPRQRALMGRSTLDISPREGTLQELTAVEDLLERGVVRGDSTLLARRDSLRVALGAPADRKMWEEGALRVWRDSLAAALETPRDKAGELAVISPFALEMEGRVKRQSVAVIDPETGRLVQAFWYFPAYAEYGLYGVDEYGRNLHTIELRKFRQELARLQVGGPAPVVAAMDDRYQLDAGGEPASDLLHRYGRFARRDVLSYEQMMAYPVLALCYIDAESTQHLTRYLLAGGYALVDDRQLEGLERALGEAAAGRVRRTEIWSGHPLMASYYLLEQYLPMARGAGVPPLQGLEVDGRLVAVALSEAHPSCSRLCAFSCDPELFANAAMYGLIQFGNLAQRYSAK